MNYALILLVAIILVIASLSSVSGTYDTLQGLWLVIQYTLIFIAGVSLKTSLYSLSIIAVALIGGFAIHRMANPLYSEAVRIERFMQARHKEQGHFRDKAAYIRIRRALTKPLDLGNGEADILREWIRQYRIIFDNLPAIHPIETRDNTMAFQKRTQFKLLRISRPMQSVLFILHEEADPDTEVETVDFKTIPTVEELVKLIGKSISKDHITVCLDNLHRGIKDGFTGEPFTSRWAYLYLPNPISKFDFRGMLQTYLSLDGLV